MRSNLLTLLAARILSLAGCKSTGGQSKEVGVPKLEEDEMEKSYRSEKVAGRVFHTFTPNDLRNQMLSFSPEFYATLSPEALSEIFTEYQKIYGLEIETGRTGISSDEEMTQYLRKSGVAKELGLNQASVHEALNRIDWKSRCL